MLQRSLRHRAPVLWLLLPFIAGLITGRLGLGAGRGFTGSGGLLGLAALILVGTFFVRKRFGLWAVGFCLATSCAAAAYFRLCDDRLAAWDDLPPRELRLTISIDRTFAGGAHPSRLSGIASIVDAGSRLAELRGRRLYFALQNAKGVPALRSAQLKVRGVLQAVRHDSTTTSFDGYLINAGVNLRLDRGWVLAEVRDPTRYARFCAASLQRLSFLLGVGLEKHPDLASASRALFLGEVTELGTERKQLYIDSGTLHFFAIDGLHIAAVAVALHLLLGLLRCPRSVLFLTVATILWLYADITGRSPSAVRAVLTVGFFEGAFLLKRPINPLAGLSASAFISLVLAPHELFGASFQMSYGIVAALLLLGLPLAETWQERWSLFRRLPKISWKKWQHASHAFHRAVIGAAAIGLSTALFGDLCGVMFFQLYAPGGLLANLLLIPVATAGLWAAFLALVTGLAGLSWLTVVFNRAAALALDFMERCIQFLVTLPGAMSQRSFRSPTLGYLSIGLLLGSLLYGYANRWELRRGGWFPPFAITIAALLFLSVASN